MTNECERIRERLTAFVEGDLPAGERELVDAHVTGCADCAADLAVERRMHAALAGDAPPALLLAAARADLDRAIEREQSWRPAMAWVALAASIAAMLVLALTLLGPSARPTGDVFRDLERGLVERIPSIPSPPLSLERSHD